MTEVRLIPKFKEDEAPPMAENVKVLRRRVRSIRNTKQITRAMEMVSAAKLRRAQDLLLAGRPYAGKLQELLGHLASSADTDHPLFAQRDVRRRLVVVVTADRGLAGAFNAQIIKRAEAVRRNSPVPVTLGIIGKKANDYFKGRGLDIAFAITDMAGRVSAARAREVAENVTQMFMSGEVDEVTLIYNRFISTIQYVQMEEQLLPLDPDALLGLAADHAAHGGRQVDYILEPSPKDVFTSLLPRFVASKIYITLAETFTAEHAARMVSMSAATKNCEELISSLTLRMNKARQAAITKEILEIVGGAEALKG